MTMHMNPVVAKAIIAVCREVPGLGYDAKNEHGGYRYVSIDQFNAQIGALMAKHGLILLTHEDKIEVLQTGQTSRSGAPKRDLHARYELWLFTEGGEAYGPIYRECTVDFTGPQSYGAAKSYVEKYFMRSLFRVPTGDYDADADAPRDKDPDRREERKEAPRREPPPPPLEMLPPDESATVKAMMITAISMALTRDDLLAFSQENSAKRQQLQPEDAEAVIEAFKAQQAAIRKAREETKKEPPPADDMTRAYKPEEIASGNSANPPPADDAGF